MRLLLLCVAGGCIAIASKANGQLLKRAVAVVEAAPLDGVELGCTEAPGGTIEFAQEGDADTVVVTLELVGITPGLHGLHVHQYGDTLNGPGLHFVETCVPTNASNPCVTLHGIPPNATRQNGDMGNLLAEDNCTVSAVIDIGQDKMSLSDASKSIVGRAVVIHRDEDTGEQPFGNAGPAFAFGVIGAAADTEAAVQGPVLPVVIRTYCEFVPLDGSALVVSGDVLIERTGDAQLLVKAKLEGLDASGSHAVALRLGGDLTDADGSGLGAEFAVPGVSLPAVRAGADGTAEYRVAVTSSANVDLADVLGKGLTVHATALTSSAIIGRALCGVPNPQTELVLSIDPETTDLGDAATNFGPFAWGLSLLCIALAL